MVEVLPRRGRRADAGRQAAAAAEYAQLGWPVCPGAVRLHAGSSRNRVPALAARGRPRGSGRACSCDRIGCPAPGAHPISAAWQVEATTDATVVEAMWAARPDANVILATGRVFDVLDVPAPLGLTALNLMAGADIGPGPVALSAGDRALFFVLTRG